MLKVDRIEFELSVKNKKPIGQAIIDFTIVREEKSHGSHMQVNIPLDTIWIDREKRCAIKAHLRISTGNVLHVMLFSAIYKFGYVRTNSSGQFLTADRNRIIRYGNKDSDRYSDIDAEFNVYYAYDSFVQAMRLCMETVGRHRQLGGLEAVSFRHINPEVLVEFGFEDFRDFFGVGPSMWKGSTDSFLKMREGYAPASEIRNNAKSFLKYVRASLNEQDA